MPKYLINRVGGKGNFYVTFPSERQSKPKVHIKYLKSEESKDYEVQSETLKELLTLKLTDTIEKYIRTDRWGEEKWMKAKTEEYTQDFNASYSQLPEAYRNLSDSTPAQEEIDPAPDSIYPLMDDPCCPQNILHIPFTKKQKIALLSGCVLLSIVLIILTVLTAGAAAGVILPGAMGFLGAVSTITGLTTASLATASGFSALLALATGSFILSLMTMITSARVLNLHYKEAFFRFPKKFKDWINKLTPTQKLVSIIGFALLSLGLIALCGWAIASTLGLIAAPMMIGTIFGSFSGGFLTTVCGGLATLIGIAFTAAILGGTSSTVAIAIGTKAEHIEEKGEEIQHWPEFDEQENENITLATDIKGKFELFKQHFGKVCCRISTPLTLRRHDYHKII